MQTDKLQAFRQQQMRCQRNLNASTSELSFRIERDDPVEDFRSHIPRFPGDLSSPLSGTGADPWYVPNDENFNSNPSIGWLLAFVAMQICVGLTIFVIF